MAFRLVQERNNQRSTSEEQSGSSVVRRHVRSWVVETDDPKIGSYSVQRAPGIPRRGDKHNEDSTATVTSITADPAQGDDSHTVWVVAVTYTSNPLEQSSGGSETQQRYIRFNYVNESKFTTVDYHGNTFKSTGCGELLGGIDINHSLIQMTVSSPVDYDLVTPALMEQYRDMVHGDNFNPQLMQDGPPKPDPFPTFFGFGSWKTKFMDWGADSELLGNKMVFRVNLSFLIKRTWLVDLLNQGFYRCGGSPGETSSNPQEFGILPGKTFITDLNGMPVANPQPLDNKGHVLGENTKPYFWWHQVYPHGDLNALMNNLKLPTSLASYKIKFTD